MWCGWGTGRWGVGGDWCAVGPGVASGLWHALYVRAQVLEYGGKVCRVSQLLHRMSSDSSHHFTCFMCSRTSGSGLSQIRTQYNKPLYEGHD